MKKTFLLLAFFSLTGCFEAKQQSAPVIFTPATSKPAMELKIASWNMEWLDTTPKESYQQRSDEDYKKYQEYANMLNADVIAFQEVADAASIESVLGKDKYNIVISSRESDQRTGFAVKKNISFKDNGENKAISLNGSVRNGIDITLSNGDKNIRLLNVHLKSRCFTNDDEKRADRKKDCRKHNQQIAILDEWIAAREKEGIPYGILGDFNRRLKRDNDKNAEILSKEKGETVLTFIGHDDASECKNVSKQGKIRSYSEFIDHIALSNKAMEYYQENTFVHQAYEIDDKKNYKLSDHCPISIKLNM